MEKLFVGMTLLVLLFSGCSAEKEPNPLVKQTPPPLIGNAENVQNSVVNRTLSSVDTAKKMPDSLVVKQTPSSVGKAAPRGGRQGVIFKAPSQAAAKTAPKANRDTNETADNNGVEQQSAPNLPDCDGIPSNVSPRVLSFLTCKVVQILSQPEKVESFLLIPKADTSVPRTNRLGRFPIKADGQGLNLEGENLDKFKKLVFSEDSYRFGWKKKCRFSPDVGLHFVKGDKAVEVLFSLDCNLWLFVYGEEEKLEDFDPIQSQFTFLNSLFPVDMEMPETPPSEESETPTETPENSVET